MLANLGLGTAMVAATTLIHMAGLLGLMKLMARGLGGMAGEASDLRQGATILLVVLGVFIVHAAQIWLYAVVFLVLGALPTMEEALYFSAATFSTVGYGDVVLDESWRLLAAIESANGFLLIGWS
ncbi:MAG: potassium channel family protein, partial [Caulobacterales bacterium]|nr:potassium channel family protein [Caulobacterales bacterium]